MAFGFQRNGNPGFINRWLNEKLLETHKFHDGSSSHHETNPIGDPGCGNRYAPPGGLERGGLDFAKGCFPFNVNPGLITPG